GDGRLLVAARVGETRLIDNAGVTFGSDPSVNDSSQL
ncbi:MAG: pantoate--beta-alanine ligase, partial [Mycobacteriaceae bacterium]